MLIKITKIEPFGPDERGQAYGFPSRESGYFIVINRKKGTVSGKHYHKGLSKSRDPEIFYLIKGEIKLVAKNVKTGETSVLEVGAVFVFIGFHPNTDILPGDIEKNDAGYLITDTKMETSISGIYACGDVREQLVRQITNAVGDGTTAAMAAVYRIEELEG